MKKNINENIGAAAVETAIVAFLLIVLTFGIIEIGRYYSIKSEMSRAAKKGLELAIRHDDFLVDIENATGPDKIELEARLNAAVDEVRARINTFPFNKNNLASTQYLGRTNADGIMILRPSESGSYIDPVGNRTVSVTHPTFPLPSNGQNMLDLMRSHPILIEINASMPSILPFLGDIRVRAEAIGIAEIPPAGIEAVPGNPEFVPPSCNDGRFTPGIEECDRVGADYLGIDASQYCDSNCKRRKKCGNGVKEIVTSKDDPDIILYEEDCDKLEGTTEYETTCDSSCKLKDIHPCVNGRLDSDTGEDCDWLVGGFDYEKFICADTNPEKPGVCTLHRYPNCGADAELKFIACPNDLEGRLVCFECVGIEAGECNDGKLDDGEVCDGDLRAGGRIPGFGDTWYCDGCKTVVDLCGNGKLDVSPSGYVEGCDRNLVDGGFIGAIGLDEYCDLADCQVKKLCGNRKLDSAAGEDCEHTLSLKSSFTTEEIKEGWTCGDDCKRFLRPCVAAVTCFDGSQPIWIDNRNSSDPDEGECRCPVNVGT